MAKSSTSYNCIIIDDEPNAIEVIRYHLEAYPDYRIESTFTDGFSALNWLKSNQADIVFLDVQMPGISGIDVLRNLKPSSAVFLTTAYRHYAPEAFEFEVLDYLLKPISGERLRKALLKFEEAQHQRRAKPVEESIQIRANRADIKIQLAGLLYLEAMGDYVKCHTINGVYLTKESLASFAKRLPELHFRQIHRSFIVNLDQITSRSAREVQVADRKMPISRSFRF